MELTLTMQIVKGASKAKTEAVCRASGVSGVDAELMVQAVGRIDALQLALMGSAEA